MGFPEDTALGIENRQPYIYQMNECDWWCDYSIEEAKKNYVKFVGTDPETQDWEKDPPIQLTEEDMDKYKFQPDGEEITILSFREELCRRITNNEIPGFFASTEY